MFWYSWQMALLSLIVVPPYFLLALIATPFLQRISREIFGALNSESSYLIEALTGVRTIKSVGSISPMLNFSNHSTTHNRPRFERRWLDQR
jgi:ABC-type bacteriocin/lantibiotic exporter with double-glycine peptidase domain